MGPWVIPAASAAASAVQSYLASRGSKRGYEMGDYEQRLYDMLAAQLKDRNVPGSITAPFVQGAKNIQQEFSRRPGETGTEHGLLQRKAYTPMAEASGQYLESKEARIQALMAGLARGTGTQTFQQPFDISPSLEDIGWMMFELSNKKKPNVNMGGSPMGDYPSYPGIYG